MRALLFWIRAALTMAPTVASTVHAQDLNNGLLVDLPLNGVATDTSGNGNDGQWLGGAYTNGVSGQPGGALHLTGGPGQGVVVPDSAALRPGTMTVSTWIRTSGPTEQIAIKAHYPTSTDQMWSFYIDYDSFSRGSPSLVLAVKRNSGGTSAGWYYGYSKPLTLTNQWVMVTGGYDGNSIRLFVNGAPVTTMEYPAAIPPGPVDSIPGGEINIGRSSIPQYPFVGEIAQFKLYSRTLSDAEVRLLYESSGGAPETRTATATAIVDNGFVVGVTLTDGGAGYSYAPNVALVGGGGSGASVVALETNGVVTAFEVLNAGHGYSSHPSVLVDAPKPRAYRPAIASPTVVNGFVVGFQVTDSGAGYTNAPGVTITGGSGSGASATATVSEGRVTGLHVVSPGSGYATPPMVEIAAPGPFSATGAAWVGGGKVLGVALTYRGSGYAGAPQVSFIGGGGTGAQAQAIVADGGVIDVQITNPGAGYTTAPILRIDPPSAASLPATSLQLAIKTVQVAETVVAGRTYALEFSADLLSWDQVGSPFTPASTTAVVDVDVHGSASYFRLRDLTLSP